MGANTPELRVLDLFCCAGGASRGLHLAGFQPNGVDIEPQPEYPYPMTVQSVLSLTPEDLRAYDLIWASPPCQAFTAYKRRTSHVRPALNLIPETLTRDDLERCRNLGRNTRDADRWSAVEWLKLYAAYQGSGWDVTPDDWTQDQIEAALERGECPDHKETHG